MNNLHCYKKGEQVVFTLEQADAVFTASEGWQKSAPTGIEDAVMAFKAALPGWWFSVGECQVSADASCGPTRESPHIALISKDRRFDDGFHADLPQPSTMADALRDVQEQAIKALKDLGQLSGNSG